MKRSAFERIVALVTLVSFLGAIAPRTARADDAPPAAPQDMVGGQASLGSPETGAGGSGALATADVEPSTGVLHASIAFDLATARGAVQPSLSLAYSSVSGWGAGGYGWHLNVPSIEIHNLSGPPTYSGLDRFEWAGKPLVPICAFTTGGACSPVAPSLYSSEPFPNWVTSGWTYYRLAVEDGSLARFFFNGVTWVVQYASGETAEYGAPFGTNDYSGLDVDYAQPASQATVGPPYPPFRFNLVRRYDSQRSRETGQPSNAIIYEWETFPIQGAVGHLVDIYDTAATGSTASASNYAHHTHLNWLWESAWTLSNPVYRATSAYSATLIGVDITGFDYGTGSVAPGTRQQIRRYRLSYQDPRRTTSQERSNRFCSKGAAFIPQTRVRTQTSSCPQAAPFARRALRRRSSTRPRAPPQRQALRTASSKWPRRATSDR
jgi:Salmonella virulence plasmid 65kDa B protein